MQADLSKAIAVLEAAFPNGFSSTVTFDIEQVGSVTIDSDGVREGGGEAELVVRGDARTLAGIIEGRLNPAAAYLAGEISISGNLGIASALARRLQ